MWEKLRTHSIIEIKNLLGLKSKNVNDLKKSIKRIIDELKERGYVDKWAMYGRGWDTKYRIRIKFKKKLFVSNLLKNLKE